MTIYHPKKHSDNCLTTNRYIQIRTHHNIKKTVQTNNSWLLVRFSVSWGIGDSNPIPRIKTTKRKEIPHFIFKCNQCVTDLQINYPTKYKRLTTDFPILSMVWLSSNINKCRNTHFIGHYGIFTFLVHSSDYVIYPKFGVCFCVNTKGLQFSQCRPLESLCYSSQLYLRNNIRLTVFGNNYCIYLFLFIKKEI